MTQLERVLTFLKAHPGEQFIAKDIAASITQQFADDYTSKRNNPRFADERSFTAQVAAEIGAQARSLQHSGVSLQDRPRPRKYSWPVNGLPSSEESDSSEQDNTEESEDREVPSLSQDIRSLREHDLYPVLMDYLKSELQLYCLRINELTLPHCVYHL